MTINPEELLKYNQAHAKKMPDSQAPKYLWIGCVDSRVLPNEILGLGPGEMLVHRNIANMVNPQDTNGMSVIQFAVDILKVEHIIVCGHSKCGGVQAVQQNKKLGLADEWLKFMKPNSTPESNVRDQVNNVSHLSVVQNALKNGQSLTIHGWLYHLETGLLSDLLS